MFGLAIFIHKLQNLAKMLLMISSLIFSITTQKKTVGMMLKIPNITLQ